MLHYMMILNTIIGHVQNEYVDNSSDFLLIIHYVAGTYKHWFSKIELNLNCAQFYTKR